MHKLACLFTLVAFVFLSVLPAVALNPDETLSDPALEQRARSLSVEIRCLVCQNQSIDDSDADLARDLRVLVREQLLEGKSDTEILDYLVERYGEFVLLKPRFGLHTLALWFFPFAIFLVGVFAFFRVFRRSGNPVDDVAALSDAEQAELDKLTTKRD